MKKVFIQTYGCQMNLADSEEMFSHLSARGYQLADSLEQADLVLINTCTVRDHAEHKAISFLGRLAAWKKSNPQNKIIFAGCAAQRMGKKLLKMYPFLDIVSGAKEIESFSDLLDKNGIHGEELKETTPLNKGLTGYVTIMRGCNFACTYCIVPSVRGPIKSLATNDILQDVQKKVQNGAKEIVLLGQTVNAYKYQDTSFADLLNQVSEVKGVERVRFTSPHPIYFTPSFINAIKDNPKIARHVHLPMQSGSTKVLSEMKRGYSREQFLETIQLLHSIGFNVSTDIIVGFPTETEQDFEQTLSIVEEAKFSAAYCFKYSPRQGTPAASWELLPQNILEQRLDILLNKVRDLADKAYKTQVGTTQEVLFETETKGRSSGNFWVKTAKQYPIGSVVKVDVEKADGTLLFARD